MSLLVAADEGGSDILPTLHGRVSEELSERTKDQRTDVLDSIGVVGPGPVMNTLGKPEVGDHRLRIAAETSVLDLGRVNEGASKTPVTRVAEFMLPPLPTVEPGTQFQAVEGPVALETHDCAIPLGRRVCPVDDGWKSRNTASELLIISSAEFSFFQHIGQLEQNLAQQGDHVNQFVEGHQGRRV